MRFLLPPMILLLPLLVNGQTDCSFNQGSCAWRLEPPWNRVTVGILPTAFSTVQQITSDGPFLLAQGQFGAVANGELTAQLDPNEKRGVLSFRYLRTGSARMKIVLRTPTADKVVDQLEDSPQPTWIRRNIILDAIGASTKLVFSASNISTSHDVIAIDDVAVQYPSVLWAGKDSVFFDRNDIESRDIRRAPRNGASDTCHNIKCAFKGDSCSWSTANFHVLTSKIVSEGSGEAMLISEPTLFPMNAHFQMDLYTSDSSTTSISLRSGSEESLLWTQNKLLESGWNHVRFPIKYTPLPATILVRSFCPPGGYVAISNTDLVDESGRPLTCGSNTLPIRPQHENVIRLTAIQKTVENSLQYNPPLIGPTVPKRPLMSMFKSIDPSPETVFAALPISPVQVSTRNTFLPFLPPTTTTTVKPVLHGIRAQRPVTVKMIATTPRPVEDSDLLKNIAKQFGFPNLQLNSGQLEKLSGLISMTGGQNPFGNALTARLSEVIKPPAGYGDDSKPFTRKNMDEIVENAYRKYGGK